MTDNRPIHSINYGTIALAIWRQEESGFLDVTIKRRFKKDADTWASAHNFGEYDLPILAKAILDAHSWIQSHKTPTVGDMNLPAVVNSHDTQEPD